MTEATPKAPWHLWLVGILATLFNAFGAFDYVMSKMNGAEYMASAGMTSEQIAFIQGYPAWMTAMWAIGVWGALLGSVCILMRKKLAFPLLLASTAAWLVSLLYTYVLEDAGSIWGTSMLVVSAVITAELLFLIWYSRAMAQRGLLR